MSANVATGTLRDRSVTLSGSHVWPPPQSELDGASFFEDPGLYTPAMRRSDHIQISGFEGYSYTLSFSAPVTDPVLHIASVASTLQFQAGTEIAKVSGSPNFSVSGSTVTGDLQNNAGGTIRLLGDISTVTFTATPLYSPPIEDGIVLQVGAR